MTRNKPGERGEPGEPGERGAYLRGSAYFKCTIIVFKGASNTGAPKEPLF